MKKYYTKEAKKEASLANKARYREANREKLKAAGAEYRAKNKEQIKQYGAKRYRKIKEEHNAQMKLWRDANKDLMCHYAAKRRADELQRTPGWLSKADIQEIAEFYEAAQVLSKIFPYTLHVDHIVPLRGNGVSGLHVPWNLQLLPAKVNLGKSNKLLEEFSN